MGDLRELKPEDRAWTDDDGGNEDTLRKDFEEALKEGERISLIWAHPHADGNVVFSYKHGRRQGCRMSWAEFLGVMQGVIAKYFRDVFNA